MPPSRAAAWLSGQALGTEVIDHVGYPEAPAIAALQRTVAAQITRNCAGAVNMAEGEARAAALKDLITNGHGARTLS